MINSSLTQNVDAGKALNASAIAARVRHVAERKGSGLIAIHTRERWAGGERLDLGDTSWPVRYCSSVLEIALAVDALSEEPGYGVLLTPLAEAALPQDMLARLLARQFHQLQPWDTVRDLFGAQAVDPRLRRERWMAERLMEDAPLQGYPPVRGVTLDADTAWDALCRQSLGIDGGTPDARALFAWAREPATAARWGALAEGGREAIRARFQRYAGQVGRAILGALEASHCDDLLAIGLACELLFEDGARIRSGREVAVGRLERFLGGETLSPEAGQQLQRIAEATLRNLEESERYTALRSAQSLLDKLQIGGAAETSRLLEAGYTARLEAFGKALNAAVGGEGDAEAIHEALQAIAAHMLAMTESERLERLHMALRLVRYLQQRRGSEEPASLTSLVAHYRNEESYVDWARRSLLGGEANETVSGAMTELLQAVRSVREAMNERFAKHLQQWQRRHDEQKGLLPIEHVIDTIVAPLAAQMPVLLLVLDGMDGGAYRELEADLLRRGWAVYGPDGSARIATALSALPSVTQSSRASLFSGTLTTGDSSYEKRELAKHPALARIIARGMPRPVLHHKGDLGEEAGSLSDSVRTDLEDPRKKVVGAVVNAIDDHLSKSDQLRLSWKATQFRQLEALLDAARVAGRAVVLTSDHGHVMEWGSKRPSRSEEGRWRSDDGAPGAGELTFRSPEIAATTQQDSVILPWSEAIRYAGKRNGYHGGVALQEVVIPVAVLRPASSGDDAQAPAGWTALPDRLPEWWSAEEPKLSETRSSYTTAAERAKPEPRRSAPDRGPQVELFAEVPAAVEAPLEGPALIDALLGSPTFQRQHAAAGRMAPREEVVRAALEVLLGRGGRIDRKAMAVSLRQPEFRIRSQLAAMERVLNVDGYQVIREVQETGEIQIDRRLLLKQFELKQ